jgi:hypothetical protein
MTYDFKVGDDVRTNDGAGRIINREYSNFHVQLEQGVYVYTAEMMKPLENDLPPFEQNVRRILSGVGDTIVAKNLSYGDSALNPIRVFSKADRMEQLYTRLDDKLSRVQKGHEYPGDDTIRDIIGYCTLILIAREGE